MKNHPSRLATVPSAGLAAALAFVAMETSAAVVETTLDPVVSAGPSGAVGLSFNPVTAQTVVAYDVAPLFFSACFGTLSFFGRGTPAPDANQFFQVGLLRLDEGTSTIPLSLGTTISALAPEGLTWTDSDLSGGTAFAGANPANGLLTDDTIQHFGFRFKTTETSDWNYGYVSVSQLFAFPDTTLTIHGFAYENSGGAITVSSTIPEPSAFALLGGACALGFAATRRRRRAA